MVIIYNCYFISAVEIPLSHDSYNLHYSRCPSVYWRLHFIPVTEVPVIKILICTEECYSFTVEEFPMYADGTCAYPDANNNTDEAIDCKPNISSLVNGNAVPDPALFQNDTCHSCHSNRRPGTILSCALVQKQKYLFWNTWITYRIWNGSKTHTVINVSCNISKDGLRNEGRIFFNLCKLWLMYDVRYFIL